MGRGSDRKGRAAAGGGKRRAGTTGGSSRQESGSRDAALSLQQSAGNRATSDLLDRGQRSGEVVALRSPGSAKSPGGLVARNGTDVVQREGPTPPPPPNFDELEEAYKNTAEMERSLYEYRAIGAREALGDLKEEDEPSIGDILLHAAVMGALGYASGGITQRITNRILHDGASQAIQTAVQSGLDDAMKDLVPAAVNLALAKKSTSRSAYFAGIEAGLVKLKEEAVRALNAQERKAKEDARANPTTLAAALAGVKTRQKTLAGLQATGQELQYRESLSRWLTAMAEAKLGTQSDGGAEMKNMPGHGGDPSRFFHQKATAGVLRLSFGIKSARRPLSINWGVLTGLNDATKERLKDTTIKELRIPVFTQGWIIDGFWDGVGKGDNEVTMSMNETGTVFVNYGSDAEDAMKSSKFANGKSEITDIARDVLENDIGNKTLGSINGLY